MRLFAWLAGTDEQILSKCTRGERRKAVAMGATIAVTVGFAAVAASFTVYVFLRTSIAVGVLAGLCWGTAILALDRWLVISIRRQRSWQATLMLALPRVALAVVVGLAIATPFDLKMFEGEITIQAAEEKQQNYRAGEQALDSRYGEISTLEGDTARLAHKIDTLETGTELESNPAYQLAAREAATLHSEAQAARAQALCELDGTCGTKRIGEGPVYAKKAEHAANLATQASEAQSREDQIRGRLLEEEASKAQEASGFERQELAALKKRLTGLRGERARQEAHLSTEYKRPIGLADRLDALSSLEGSHPSVRTWSVLITLIIMFIDTAPALGKAFMAIGEPTLYEREQMREENTTAEKNELRGREDVKAAEIEAQIPVEEAELKRSLWKDAMQGIVARQVAVEAELARLYVARWEEHAREQVDQWTQEAFRSGRGRPGQPADPRETPPGDLRTATSREVRRNAWLRRVRRRSR